MESGNVKNTKNNRLLCFGGDCPKKDDCKRYRAYKMDSEYGDYLNEPPYKLEDTVTYFPWLGIEPKLWSCKYYESYTKQDV